MESLWDETEAAQFEGDLGQCVYLARLLGQQGFLFSQAGTSVSVKVGEQNIFREDETFLYVSGSRQRLAAIESRGFARLRLRVLVRLVAMGTLSGAELAKATESAAVDSGALALSPNILVHAVVPAKYVAHVHSDGVLALANSPDGLARLAGAYADTVTVIPYARSGAELAARCAAQMPVACRDNDGGLVLMQQGILAYGETPQRCYERVVELVSLAKSHIAETKSPAFLAPSVSFSAPSAPLRLELAALRQEVSTSAGFPLIMSTDSSPKSVSFARRNDVGTLSQRGPASPDHVAWTRHAPLVGRDVTAYAAGEREASRAWATSDRAPRVILDPEFGMCAVGRSAQEAATVGDLYRHTMDIILASESLGGYVPLPVDVASAAFLALDEAAVRESDEQLMFVGEVALVTGAASGIGRACVQAFLERGAAVVGLDISPDVVRLYDGPGYLGLRCDMTDEDAVCQALEAAVRAYGGLDMLVPNAGVFPKGCPIASLSMAEWRRVMAVNLDANLVLMREAYPLLRCAPRKGRVVVMSSRNVPAPGPGAVAYSASKAALTQMARIAALEWGGDGIRVNMLNPHAVFDTGIWTEEVLNARAAHYGITVEQYKRNNVLGAEIASRDVAELAAEMCGPLFSKTTGAQVPIDGGSNRVI